MKKKILILLCALLALIPLFAFAHAAKADDSGTYYIEVDLTNQIVTIFRRSDMIVVRKMICSSGKASTPTPQGTFYLPSKSRPSERQKWYRMADCWVQYATRIRGGYMFHSYLFNAARDSAVISSSVRALGTAVSHGCIRLRINDAKYIADNCPAGTKVYIYKSGKRNEEIRKLLKNKTYSIDCGKSWEEWAGLGDADSLGRGDRGARVLQLQNRLVGMGWAKLANDGIYGQSTLDGVKRFQKAAGLRETGVTDKATWNALFAKDAPEGTKKVTLFEGANGTRVSQLQETLTRLLLYNGKINGTFDKDTKKAVNLYHEMNGEDESGQMTHDQARNAEKTANALIKQYGEHGYKLVKEKVDVEMAKVKKSKKYIYIRKKASTKSKKVKKLKKNATMEVLERGDKWSLVTVNGKNGYVQTKFVKFYTETRTKMYYMGINETPTPPVTPTPSPTPVPTATPTPKPTATPTSEPTAAPTPEPTATPTPEPTATPTPEPTATPTPEPTATPTPEPTATPTPEPTETPTPEPTDTPTPEPTDTPTPEPTNAPASDTDEP